MFFLFFSVQSSHIGVWIFISGCLGNFPCHTAFLGAELEGIFVKMELKGSEKETVVTQVSIGGFDSNVNAKELMDFLEIEVGVVFRCRLKTSWTPPESYPTFYGINLADIKNTDGTRIVTPHAFVHFASPISARQALEDQLMLHNQPLKVTLGPNNPFRMNQRRRNTTPIKLSDVVLEIGTLVRRDEFLAAWRGRPHVLISSWIRSMGHANFVSPGILLSHSKG